MLQWPALQWKEYLKCTLRQALWSAYFSLSHLLSALAQHFDPTAILWLMPSRFVGLSNNPSVFSLFIGQSLQCCTKSLLLILNVPLWQTQSWVPWLLDMLVDMPVVFNNLTLPRTKNVVTVLRINRFFPSGGT